MVSGSGSGLESGSGSKGATDLGIIDKILGQTTHADSPDYVGLSMVEILFLPDGGMSGSGSGSGSGTEMTECLDIRINMDLVVEEVETFRFLIDPVQEDGAVSVGSPDSAIVSILDTDDGM